MALSESRPRMLCSTRRFLHTINRRCNEWILNFVLSTSDGTNLPYKQFSALNLRKNSPMPVTTCHEVFSSTKVCCYKTNSQRAATCSQFMDEVTGFGAGENDFPAHTTCEAVVFRLVKRKARAACFCGPLSPLDFRANFVCFKLLLFGVWWVWLCLSAAVSIAF